MQQTNSLASNLLKQTIRSPVLYIIISHTVKLMLLSEFNNELLSLYTFLAT